MNEAINPIMIGARIGGFASGGVAGIMYGKKTDSALLRGAKGSAWSMLGGAGTTAAAMGTDRNGGAISRFVKGTGLGLGMALGGAGIGAGVNMLMRRGR